MALEQVFKCPRTLQKLQRDPLGKLLPGFCDWLLKHGFSPWTIRKHLSNVSHLNEYLNTRSDGIRESLSSEEVSGFFRSYPSRCPNQRPLEKRLRNSINRFVDYLRQRGLFDPLVNNILYRPLMDGYLEWMRNSQHASAGTLDLRCHSLSQFLQWLGPKATPQGLSELTPETLERFFLPYAQKMGRSARRCMQSALRTFFRFCLHQGYVQRSLDCAVPTWRTYKLDTVPRGLTDEQADKLLQSIHRKHNPGRRDYAIGQLLYTYGVRGTQVRALRLQDIDWEKDQILFKASKHGKDILLPLTAAVGESLLDYLQNAPPRCPYPEVFLTTRAPYHPLPRSSTLSAIVARYICASGITIHSKGAHAFRHGFATRMLQKGHSLKEVADGLGHRHLQTTFIYTKVDFNALKQVGLAWPQEVN